MLWIMHVQDSGKGEEQMDKHFMWNYAEKKLEERKREEMPEAEQLAEEKWERAEDAFYQMLSEKQREAYENLQDLCMDYIFEHATAMFLYGAEEREKMLR